MKLKSRETPALTDFHDVENQISSIFQSLIESEQGDKLEVASNIFFFETILMKNNMKQSLFQGSW
jgi:hypothetical protein